MHKSARFFAGSKSTGSPQDWELDLHGIQRVSVLVVLLWVRDGEEPVVFRHPVWAKLIPRSGHTANIICAPSINQIINIIHRSK